MLFCFFIWLVLRFVMPEVKPEKILSFSSEDKAYPANNLLKVSAFSKWKCQQAGAKHASVTFKFAYPVQFSRLDIGNEASAFISVEVSRVDSSEFELLLPASSFMSPADAKKGVSLNRVRIFSGSELTPSVSSQKWDVVRVNCTQPFNTEVQYGLALAKRSGELQEKSAITSVADVKAATPSTVTQKLLQENRSAMDSQGATVMAPSTSAALQASSAAGDMSSVAEGGERAGASEKGQRILDGVVVAFSGYKNPFRSELREMCMRLGAKYRQDWTDDCTHLICAFPNTPKWNAVKGKGIITSHKWIQACNAAQRCVSWRPYRVGRAPSPVGHISDGNSDVDRSMVEDEKSDEWRPDGSDQDGDESDESSGSDVSEESQSEGEESGNGDDSDGGEESKAPRQKKRKAKGLTSSTSKAPRNKKFKTTRKGSPLQLLKPKGESVEDEDTDEEVQRNLGNNPASTQHAGPLPPLPDCFSGRKFYIFSKDFDVNEEEIVCRLIIAFKGTVEPHMSTDVEFVVSRSAWCNDFDEALEVSSSLIFVKPEWIYACDKAGKMVPFQRYQIVG
ncbi:DNA repair protein XRCC1 [Taenia solium]|eukprot:TsM_000763600 transcript=TsM_000763600 gene=TsM_000763600